jgi:hypothetical protein
VPLFVSAGLDEELHFHLLELAGTEDEVARGDLIAEGLADLADAEGRLLPCHLNDIGEVHEDALRSFRTQIMQPGFVLDSAQIGLEHHVEVPRLSPLAARAAVRTGDLLQAGWLATLPRLEILFQVVGSESPVTRQAFGQRVVEGSDMPRGHPHAAWQDHRRVKADDVLPLGDHRLPPLLLDVLLELDAERAVVPGRARAAVDLSRGKDEATALAQADDAVESAGRGHEHFSRHVLRHPRLGWSQRTRLSPSA